MQKGKPKKNIHPDQHKQKKPGIQQNMHPQPVVDNEALGSGKKLVGKTALITGGDSGIGRSVAIAFARNGANVAIAYLPEEKKDAKETRDYIRKYTTAECILLPGDLVHEKHCISVVEKTYKHFNALDILVNNAGTHYPKDSIEDISSKQLVKTFETNVFTMFWMSKAALKHMKAGSCIINTGSVTAYRGSGHLIDYAATKGAIISFTRSLSASLLDKKIRVNAVAPGPVWTPLIVSSMDEEGIKTFGSDSPMGRPAQPWEIAACYLFLAGEGASYITGQVIHANGGEIVNG